MRPRPWAVLYSLLLGAVAFSADAADSANVAEGRTARRPDPIKTNAPADVWPQFKGPNASGLAVGAEPLPTQIGPTTNVVWKTPIPPGHSSPVVMKDQIYLTAERGKQLLTMALDRRTGKILWEAEAPYSSLEQIHSIGSHVQPTPASDGRHVVSFIGSAGLFCYDRMGKQLWHLTLGPFKNNFGAGSSPIIVDDRVILAQDHDVDSFIMAVDVESGKQLWKTDRSEFPRGYSTPVVWQNGDAKQIVVAGTLEVKGYDLETGREAWSVGGISRIVNMTPVVGPDGILYVPAWAPGGDDNDRIAVDPFDVLMTKQDANKSGVLERNETPAGPLQSRFDQIDRDKDGKITRQEYESMRKVFEAAKNVFLAIKPGGRGDITNTHVLWRQNRLLPYCPSPVYINGLLFMVKNGGIVSCIDAKTGKTLKQGRVTVRGDYYSSAVAGDGKVYLLSQRGDATVISAEPEWRELHAASFKEDAYATPALVRGRIYLRTAGHLWCFGLSAQARSDRPQTTNLTSATNESQEANGSAVGR